MRMVTRLSVKLSSAVARDVQCRGCGASDRRYAVRTIEETRDLADASYSRAEKQAYFDEMRRNIHARINTWGQRLIAVAPCVACGARDGDALAALRRRTVLKTFLLLLATGATAAVGVALYDRRNPMVSWLCGIATFGLGIYALISVFDGWRTRHDAASMVRFRSRLRPDEIGAIEALLAGAPQPPPQAPIPVLAMQPPYGQAPPPWHAPQYPPQYPPQYRPQHLQHPPPMQPSHLHASAPAQWPQPNAAPKPGQPFR